MAIALRHVVASYRLRALFLVLVALLAPTFVLGCAAESEEHHASTGQAASTPEYEAFHRALEGAKAAREARDASEQRLDEAIAKVALALTSDEQSAMRAAYHRGEGKAPAEAYDEAVAVMARALLVPSAQGGPREIRPQVLEAARPGEWWPFSTGGSACAEIYEAMKMLAADEEEAAAALTFAGHALDDAPLTYPNGEVGSYGSIAARATGKRAGSDELALTVYDDFAKLALVTHALYVVSTLHADAPHVPGDTSAIARVLAPVVELAERLPALYVGSSGLGQSLQAVILANPRSLPTALRTLSRAEALVPSPYIKLVLGAAAITNIYVAQQRWNEGEYLDALVAGLRASPDVIEFGAQIVKVAATRIAEAERLAAIAGRVAAKLAPPLFLAVSILQTYQAFGEMSARGDLASQVRLAGNVVAVAGFGMSTAIALGLLPTGFGTPVAIVILAGSAIQMLADFILKRAEEEARTRVARELLAGVGIEGALVETLLSAKPKRMHELASVEGLAIGPEKVRALASRYPDLITHDMNNGWVLYGVIDMAHAFRENRAFDAAALLEAVGASGEDGAFAIYAFGNNTTQTHLQGYPSAAVSSVALDRQWVDALTANKRSYDSQAPEIAAAFGAAITYLTPLVR